MITTRRISPRRVSHDTAPVEGPTSSGTPSTVRSSNDDDDDDTTNNILITPSAETEEEVASSAVKPTTYHFNGVDYPTYLEMVAAKRQRNQDVLEQSGLLTLVQQRRVAVSVSKKKQSAAPKGLQAKRQSDLEKEAAAKRPRRTSSRLQGQAADGRYVEDERAGTVTVADAHSMTTTTVLSASPTAERDEDTYRRRLHDGAPISIAEAVALAGAKWVTEHSVRHAESFLRNTLAIDTASDVTDGNNSHALLDPTLLDGLGCDDVDRQVAKICPDRIYSIAVHPSCGDDLIVCAGDKSGHVGIWKADVPNDDDESAKNSVVHLFKPHSGAVCALQWTGSSSSSQSCSNLLTASYDGTIRLLDVQQEQFLPVFATYNDDAQYRDRPGYGLERYGHKFWTQYICLDPRWNHQDCFFLSTSIGTAMHVDLRVKEPITFHEELSEKKINTLSLHPNGYSMISAGLDCTVALWDIRHLGTKSGSSVSPIASYNGGRSVNSAFFSPSGRYVVSTTMANKLDLFEDLHLAAVSDSPSSKKKPKGTSTALLKPYKSITHDNMTGRWLTTFQAIFHPQLDIFAVGSMRQPRCVELFDPTPGASHLLRTLTGDALTAVASRLAFHPRTDQLIVVGGNSSGRATIVRK